MHREEVPVSLRDVDAVVGAGWVDTFALVADDAAAWSPEQWARAALEDVSGLGGQVGWRATGMRLAWRPSVGRVAGWRIAARGQGWVQVSADSPLVTVGLAFHVDGEEMSLVTSVSCRGRLGRLFWSRARPEHSRRVPALLSDAHSLLRTVVAPGV